MDFVELVQAMDQKEIDFRLTLIGEGPQLAQLKRDFSEYVEKGVVVLPGAMDKEEIMFELEKSHFFMLLSDFEGLPLALIEAMAKGCIPLVPKIRSGIPEIVEHEQNGIVFEGRDYRQWAQSIKELVSDKKRLLAMSKAASQTIHKRYTIETIGEEWDKLFHKILTEIKQGEYKRPEVLKWKNPYGDVLPPMNYNPYS